MYHSVIDVQVSPLELFLALPIVFFCYLLPAVEARMNLEKSHIYCIISFRDISVT